MLAVNDGKYLLPVKIRSMDGQTVWRLFRKGASDYITSARFNYTIDFPGSNNDRLTFEYDGASVKPAPRTLRLEGASMCSAFVSVLSSNTKVRSFDDLIHSEKFARLLDKVEC